MTTETKRKELYVRMYDRMLLIRHFDDTADRLVNEGQLVGAVHTYVGEEAVGRQNPWGGKTSCGPPILMMQTS